MTDGEELKLLEIISADETEDWSINFWKLTDEMEKEFEKHIRGHKGDDLESLFPKDFYNEMIRQIKYYNTHDVRVDGTIPWLVEHFGSIEKTMEWALNA